MFGAAQIGLVQGLGLGQRGGHLGFEPLGRYPVPFENIVEVVRPQRQRTKETQGEKSVAQHDLPLSNQPFPLPAR